jgi:hypothetical protein
MAKSNFGLPVGGFGLVTGICGFHWLYSGDKLKAMGAYVLE